MKRIENFLTAEIQNALSEIYGRSGEIFLKETDKNFEGDVTLLTFPLAKTFSSSPEKIGKEIGEYLVKKNKYVKKYHSVKGFLNISFSDDFWLKEFFADAFREKENFGSNEIGENKKVVIEFSSPNTNKPLHLGHLRNIFLGDSLCKILHFNGYDVRGVCLVNDRGIHICKSMLAWKKFGSDDSPEKSKMKGDHFVGKYYVKFEQELKKETEKILKENPSLNEESALKKTSLMNEAQEILRKWEAGDKEILATWKQMNDWVYQGFDETYKRMNVKFDKFYYESNTYHLGKKIVERGLGANIFYKKDDGSVWVNLDEGEKLLLRSDETSVYITQDLGTAVLRYEDYRMNKSVYVVGSEQDYHFRTLFVVLKKLGYAWAENLYHLSYGMVYLPEGKMKSREGKVVDADDLMNEMFETAKTLTELLGKIEGLNENELKNLFEDIGMGALRYFILKVDPKKEIYFNPEESIDLKGHTGPFVQYTYARIKSVLRKSAELRITPASPSGRNNELRITKLEEQERALLKTLYKFPSIIEEAGKNYSPALIANYIYELAKDYNKFYHDLSILQAESNEKILFRIQLSELTSAVIKNAMMLLGIEVPERM